MSKPRALFLSPESPYPLHGGGALRTASLLEFLSQHYTVDVILFSAGESVDAGPHHRISVLELPEHVSSGLPRVSRNVGRLLRNTPPLIDRFAGFEAQIAEFCAGESYEIGVIEHFWCAPYLPVLKRFCRRVVLDLHNIESAWQESMAAIQSGLKHLALHRFATLYSQLEAKLLPAFDAVLVPSAADLNRIQHLTHATIYPNTIPFVPRPVRHEEELIVFSGNLAYEPNIAAIGFFKEKIWPLIRERSPAVRWRLVGKNPAAVQRLIGADDHIQIIGPVDDALVHLAQAKVAIVPLQAGSGTRMKILEAWAAATPVVSTTIGAEGLEANPGEHILIVDDPVEFAEAVAFLLEAPDARLQLGAAGRALYESRYTWPNAWRALHTVIPDTPGETPELVSGSY